MTYIGTVSKGAIALPPDADLAEGARVEVTPLPDGPILTPWQNETDPFANAKPITDLSRFIGGLPDDRTAEEIIEDLRQTQKPRDWSRLR